MAYIVGTAYHAAAVVRVPLFIDSHAVLGHCELGCRSAFGISFSRELLSDGIKCVPIGCANKVVWILVTNKVVN